MYSLPTLLQLRLSGRIFSPVVVFHFTLQFLKARQPLRFHLAMRDCLLNRTSRFGLMRAISESAGFREQSNFFESTIEACRFPELEFPHSGRIDQHSTGGQWE